MIICQKSKNEPRYTAGRANWLMLILTACALVAISCQKQPTEEPAGEPIVTTSTEPAEPYIPAAMDSKDDPAAPRALPRSNEAQGWIKTAPIEVAAGQGIPILMADQEMDTALSGYRIERIAKCEYTSANATARVLLVEARSDKDAFGVFGAVEPHPGCSPRVDNSLRGVHHQGKTLKLTAWQGKTWVQFTCTLEKEEAGIKDCERLMDRTMFSIVSGEPPMLVRAVQDVKMERCDSWFVRSVTKLTKLDQPTLRRLDAEAVNERLGLPGDDVTLSVMAIQQAADSALLVVWMAEYPTAEEAKSAAERYTKALQTPSGGLDGQTLVGPAKGRVVVGTWSADQEAGRNLVKMLGQALPE